MSDELTEVRAELERIADELCGFGPWDIADGVADLGNDLRAVIASLSAAVPHSAPTTAQGGPETLRNESGGVSGEPWEFCPDCAAPIGEEHGTGCDVARCLATGWQRLMCDSPHDHGRDYWNGRWPGEAECEEFGWFTPDGQHDLNRLAHAGARGELQWVSTRRRWTRPDAMEANS